MDLLESSDSDEDDLLGQKNELSLSRSSLRKKIIAPISMYHRLEPVTGIQGFIVNVHNSINYDIDFTLTPAQMLRYQDVITNTYTYCDYGPAELWNLRSLVPSLARTGKTYRCRLRGIGSRHLTTRAQFATQSQMGVEIKSLVDRADGWITAVLSDIDIYRRLLVNVIVHLPNQSIDLRQYILNRMKFETNPIFYPYGSSSDSKTGPSYGSVEIRPKVTPIKLARGSAEGGR